MWKCLRGTWVFYRQKRTQIVKYILGLHSNCHVSRKNDTNWKALFTLAFLAHLRVQHAAWQNQNSHPFQAFSTARHLTFGTHEHGSKLRHALFPLLARPLYSSSNPKSTTTSPGHVTMDRRPVPPHHQTRGRGPSCGVIRLPLTVGAEANVGPARHWVFRRGDGRPRARADWRGDFRAASSVSATKGVALEPPGASTRARDAPTR